MAYWTKCAPCHLQFDVIGKVETSTEDTKYIGIKAGMPNAPYNNKRLQTRDDFSRLCCHFLATSQFLGRHGHGFSTTVKIYSVSQSLCHHITPHFSRLYENGFQNPLSSR